MGRRGNVSHATAFMVRHRAVDRGIDSDLDKWLAGRRLEIDVNNCASQPLLTQKRCPWPLFVKSVGIWKRRLL